MPRPRKEIFRLVVFDAPEDSVWDDRRLAVETTPEVRIYSRGWMLPEGTTIPQILRNMADAMEAEAVQKRWGLDEASLGLYDAES